jgi:hypothetical protein
MMVRFATLCDTCQARSEEYTCWPTCRECDQHVCERHQAEGSVVTGDGDGPDTCLCLDCHELGV